MVKKKVFKIVWDVKALNDFKEILEYLGNKDPQAPKIVKQGVLSRLTVIKTDAFIYEADKLKENINKEFRAFVVYSYRVTYQIKIETTEIRIIRIRHTSREPLGY
ncbi:MAG: type II toxin-antitoxin system RelE/ParE family toxin [Bacteroidota bacterium]|nr:type II toxin-antitoxin system RelE/ParE family toxin [Bacteroidota bacterium]